MRSPPTGFDLRGITGASVAMSSSSRSLRSPDEAAMEAGIAMLRAVRSVILARHEASASVVGLALSSSPLPTAETLQLVGDPQVWPVRRHGSMW